MNNPYEGGYYRGKGGATATLTRRMTVFGYVYEIRGKRLSSKGKLVKWEVDYMTEEQAKGDLDERGYRKDSM